MCTRKAFARGDLLYASPRKRALEGVLSEMRTKKRVCVAFYLYASLASVEITASKTLSYIFRLYGFLGLFLDQFKAAGQPSAEFVQS